MAPHVLRHRLILSNGLTPDDVLASALAAVEPPVGF